MPKSVYRSKEYRDRQVKYRSTDSYKKQVFKTHLKLRYNLTPEQYDHMIRSQGSKCAICGDTIHQGHGPKGICVDHEHDTNPIKVRDLLCGLCNRGIGYFNDNAEKLRKAADYLDKWNKEI